VQGEELEPARAKAEKMGIKQIFIDDLREEFVRDYVFPMFRCAAQQLRRHEKLMLILRMDDHCRANA
jgi:argininosuccinate synthase